ncbi:peptide-methionine (S)-S-oxide reductase MsrA [Arenicella xantha]|uniref:Peptide methionine sulfoxide reductase MsrA n=1 Tax=Arenicella xantha TaxID=644221 RepID=A0A395JJD8_9GAMM|nr:peptide-methionine (S)-S-oxide reductase MsrA [Arenicella xantha]RBP50896.1 peptide-methionine (S)-S-oxide reductase [Arenicella xantha]
MFTDKLSLPSRDNALPGRDIALTLENKHFVNGRAIMPPFDTDAGNLQTVYLGLGCFWGAERKFWQMPGVYTTAVGYMAGFTPNPTYEEVCSGRTGHTEVVLVVFDPAIVSLPQLLAAFFELHDPTQGMRQGNDKGTQYRSGIYCSSADQLTVARQIATDYQSTLVEQGYGQITTEIELAPPFYYAEQYHQQYLAKNPNGYCGIGGTGVTCPI